MVNARRGSFTMWFSVKRLSKGVAKMVPRVRRTAVALAPEKDVTIEDGRFVSQSNEPWLRIDADFGRRPFVEIAFRASLLDDPVRPILRFSTDRTVVDRILPGPVAGAAMWRGALPKGTRAVSISPTSRRGRFDFAVESIRPVGLGEMLASTWRRRPAKLWSYFLPTLFGYAAEAENALDWVNNSEPVDSFESFLARRERAFDIDGIDAPRCDWRDGPLFAILLSAEDAALDALARTLDSVAAQIYPRLCLVLVTEREDTRALVSARGDERLAVARPEDALDALPSDAFVGRLAPGDALAPHALACVAEAAARAPQGQAFYFDEIIRTAQGRRPSFKPGWSPVFQAARPYLGRGLFIAAAALAQPSLEGDLCTVEGASPSSSGEGSDREAVRGGDHRQRPGGVTPSGAPSALDLPPPGGGGNASSCIDPTFALVEEPALDNAMRAAAARLGTDQIVQIRRWLLTRDDEASTDPQPVIELAPAAPPPSVSIILLTRDKPELLGPCLDSVLRLSTHPDFELVVVDNGSRRADTLAILDAAAQDARVRVLKRPGAFDFAAFNNEAAAQTRGEVLVFLNNDTIVLSADWLEQLTRPALEPNAGAIGALLTFPDGRVQHAGVVVGIGQDAGHFGALVSPEAPCWLDRVRHVHETMAVTAACMAVERRKFEAVGGFDSEHLPIEFNDADLCLRLAERGWISRYEPSVRLVHLESASRGSAMFRPMSVYARERDYFRDRWRHVIRDDPFHHPALSLYARHVALW
jgi:GT2 family glycosyltransferase